MKAPIRPWIVAAGIMVALIAAAAPAFSFNLATLLNRGSEENLKGFKLIHVHDLAAMIANKNEHVHIYDANSRETREELGVIPGAKLLPSSDNYNVASELPVDHGALLVFYCHNTH